MVSLIIWILLTLHRVVLCLTVFWHHLQILLDTEASVCLITTEISGGGRLSGTCDIANFFSVWSSTGTSINVAKETNPSAQLITMEPADTVTQLPVSHFSTLVLADSVVAFRALWSSAVSFFVLGRLCRGCKPLSGYEERDKALHSPSRSLATGLLELTQLAYEGCPFCCLINFLIFAISGDD